MGTSRNPAEFTGKIREAGRRMEQFDRRGILPVADAVKRVFLVSASAAGLHPGSRIAGRPWRGVYVRNSEVKNLAVGYAPPAHLVNNRTRAHPIGAKKLGSRNRISTLVDAGQSLTVSQKRRIGSHVLHWGGANGPFAAYVRHPGTKGKQFYQKALPVAEARAAVEFQQSVSRTLTAVFGR